jgi:hypothetical protein
VSAPAAHASLRFSIFIFAVTASPRLRGLISPMGLQTMLLRLLA